MNCLKNLSFPPFAQRGVKIKLESIVHAHLGFLPSSFCYNHLSSKRVKFLPQIFHL